MDPAPPKAGLGGLMAPPAGLGSPRSSGGPSTTFIVAWTISYPLIITRTEPKVIKAPRPPQRGGCGAGFSPPLRGGPLGIVTFKIRMAWPEGYAGPGASTLRGARSAQPPSAVEAAEQKTSRRGGLAFLLPSSAGVSEDPTN
jgi:hypothetical protein